MSIQLSQRSHFNKVESNWGRQPVSNLGLHTYTHMHTHPHTCAHTCTHTHTTHTQRAAQLQLLLLKLECRTVHSNSRTSHTFAQSFILTVNGFPPRSFVHTAVICREFMLFCLLWFSLSFYYNYFLVIHKSHTILVCKCPLSSTLYTPQHPCLSPWQLLCP